MIEENHLMKTQKNGRPLRVAVCGSTGEIGTRALDVIARFPDEFELVSLTAGGNVALFEEQLRQFRPKAAFLAFPPKGYRKPKIEGVAWISGFEEAVCEADSVVNAVMGFAGLEVSLAAIRHGVRLCLANKETLISGGDLILDEIERYGAALLPIDSEHCAIHQCLLGMDQGFRRLILTASGGPFRDWTMEQMRMATPAQALKHPNWTMGQRITIDSATMMNKALELIEAKYLFGADAEKVSAIVHPESIVHSMVEAEDGSIIAQLGVVDMRAPIGYALFYPRRMDLGLERLELAAIGKLHFYEPDEARFPALALARDVMRAGGTSGAIANAADEAAVSIFLDGKCGFLRIVDAVLNALDVIPAISNPSLEQIYEADRRAREVTEAYLSRGAFI